MALSVSAPEFLKTLAHDIRWQLLMALSNSDLRVQELVDLLKRPQNLVSYHLRLLRETDLVHERRSSADGRDIYYSLDLDHLRTLYFQSGLALHPFLGCPSPPITSSLSQTATRVLILCTHNSARSQLAEGILKAHGGEHFIVHSAGNQPSEVHPLAIAAAAALQIDISQQQSQHLDEFADQRFDYVITVCDKVREICPAFPHEVEQIHWSLPDPVAVEGTAAEQSAAFQQTAQTLLTRVEHFLARFK